MQYQHLVVPADGTSIRIRADGTLAVPDRPIVPFIEGDGIGGDVTPVMRRVVDAAVAQAYGGRRSIAWLEVLAGRKAVARYGEDEHLPEETLRALTDFVVSIKGPLETPVGGGLRSINVAIRQRLDLYACIRPVRYFPGASTPSKLAEDVDMVVFRENTEDIYLGIEWPAGSPEARKLLDFLERELGVTDIRFPASCALGIKPVSREGSERLIRKALEYAIRYDRRSVTLVHKGNIMKHTEGAFREWGYALARETFGARPLEGGPWHVLRNPTTGREIVVKDVIADNFLQQIVLAPGDYDVIATLNLNGDYISDALAALVGGIGIAPGGNVGDGYAVFEATHGTAPSFAGKDRVNPGSLILSAEMLLGYIGWDEAAALIARGVAATIAARELTFDLALVRESARGRPEAATQERYIEGATLVGTRAFGEAVIRRMQL